MAIYLQLGAKDEIPSEVTEPGHAGWILCDSFQTGASRSMSMETGRGMQRETGDVERHEVGLRMKMNKASPKVFEASIIGDSRPAKIHITRKGTGSGLQPALEIDLTDVYVTQYSVDCDGEDAWEFISLNYVEIELAYHPVDSTGKTPERKAVGFSGKTMKTK